ncbi:Uncharacterised protein [Vibrio cholerae]|nr:Uncharacterised protein [Vibrio cholerae]CSB47240.1 Uncharacterised protein [Vibrio cholerae]CSB92108.1 Uncharacterised protein [Vibrio cholerae]CSC01853.1 Uncharacterised protein [Vibrio cholerae]CSC06525.1 Uncharacterised protein [Vibrio cholerae]
MVPIGSGRPAYGQPQSYPVLYQRIPESVRLAGTTHDQTHVTRRVPILTLHAAARPSQHRLLDPAQGYPSL